MPTDLLLPVTLGFAFGLVVALGIFVAELAVRRFVRVGTLLDVALRWGILAAIVLGASELIGTFFEPLVRAYALGFWCSFAVGFVLPLWLLYIHVRRAEGKNSG